MALPSQHYELLVNEGREQEKKYDWVAAVGTYGKALMAAFKLSHFPEAAKIYERIGFCYHRAAMQAKNLGEFKNRMLQAINAYSKAAELFEKVEDPEKIAKTCHCKAIAAYVSSWLKPDFASRKKLLDECCKLEKEALKFYEGIGGRLSLGKTCNELSMYLVDRLNLEWDKQIREKTLKEALSYGEKAIAIFSGLVEEHDLARAYYTTSIHYYNAALGLELRRKRKYEQKALTYSKKAVELSEKIGDRFLFGVSNIRLGSAINDFVGRPDSAVKCLENALQCGIHTRDNYSIGWASYSLAYVTFWKMVAEEDPKKIREESKKCRKYSEDAIHRFSLIFYDQEIAFSYSYDAENYSFLAMFAETSPEKKRILLEKSVEVARKGLEHARRSGSIRATWVILHPLSKSLFFLSTMETDADVKKRLLEESLRYREENIRAIEQAMPYYFWNQGVYHNYLALIQAELAEIEGDKEQKVRFLEEASKSAENCINLCLKYRTLSRGQYAALGRYYYYLGGILNQLYLITGTYELLGKLLGIFKGAAETYKKADMSSRAAEGYWQLAKVYNKLQNYAQSAESFEAAIKSYKAAAKKLPRLKDFYSDYATYMRAWGEIEHARHTHAKEEYGQAKEHYEKAASLHESSRLWRYLAPNYSAWAQLEHGEDLSRKEQGQEATKAFKEAAGLFSEAKQSLETELDKIQSAEEKDMAVELSKVSDLRREYCLGRITLEEAKILDKKGDHASSSKRYGLAAETFEKVAEAMEHEPDRKELRPIIYLCQAWQKMMMAEAKASSTMYGEAAELFKQAKEHALDKLTSLLALANSSFCKALEAGTRFEATRDMAKYSMAKKHMEAAANYYLKAGFKNGSDYAKATQRLFDAYIYMDKAETETEPRKKALYYQMAEKLLQVSAGSYMKAKHLAKSEEVRRLLGSLKEEQQLAMSLTEVLHAPTIMSSTTSFTIPTPTHEKAVGLERFEHANIQAHLTVPEEVTIEEDLEIQLDLVNVAKNFGLLVRVDNLVPEGFKVTEAPPKYTLEAGSIDMGGKRFEPLKVETIRISARATKVGIFDLSPQVVYVDETGQFRTFRPEAARVRVPPTLTFRFRTKASQSVFDYLTRAFVEDYMRQRLSLEKSGWRSRMQIVKDAKISKSSVYGARRRRGPAISELERRGLVETRVFPGERGRGGRINKTRIFYEKETVKRYVDKQIMNK